MKKAISALLVPALLGFAGAANADSIIESWQCKLKDDKTIEDVQAINSKWLKWAGEYVSEDISSDVGTTRVGDTTIFIFVDSCPDLATWAAAKKAFDELDEMFDEVSECDSNRLWNMQTTE